MSNKEYVEIDGKEHIVMLKNESMKKLLEEYFIVGLKPESCDVISLIPKWLYLRWIEIENSDNPQYLDDFYSGNNS